MFPMHTLKPQRANQPQFTSPADSADQLNAIEDKLDEVRDRLTRTETRLVLLMRSHGLGANGKSLD
jgi:hypothetical protein